MQRLSIRWLFLTHRYLGIAAGLLMVMWCLSGIVMMYVRYPELSEARRIRALQPIDWRQCCTLDAGGPVSSLSVEMMAGHPVALVRLERKPLRLIDLTDGRSVEHVGIDQARAVAATYGAQPVDPERIDHDQWTVSGEFRRDRPLYRFAFDDEARTRLYVSGTTGRAVQLTTRTQRFWNWLGAVPHWLYFTSLRANAGLWSQVVIWTSLIGTFLAGTGLYIGIHQIVRAPAGRWTPYRGFMAWHHLPGLVFGLLALSWIFSGFVSMNPWGFLDSDGAGPAATRLTGPPPSGEQVAIALKTLADVAPQGVVSVSLAQFDGALAFVVTKANGTRQRFDAEGHSSPALDIERAAALLGGTPELLLQGDAYYFASRSQNARLPVWRVTAGGVRYYLDPLSGALLRTIDRDARGYRWLHEGLHRLDFTPTLRGGLFRNLLMLPLLLGATLVSATGAWLGLRRLFRG